MNFVFTSCPHGGCDLLTVQFLRVQNLLKNRLGKDLFLLSISIDPKNDSPEILNKFAKKYKVDSNGWHFLSSDKKTIDRISKKHGLEWKTDPDGERHHKAVIVLLNKKGEKVIVYNDKDYNTLEIVKDIKRLLGPKA
jgi:protein SCO1/2